VGHGKLAWRALKRALPSRADFPYTIRVVSEITESNGSSSMATVCGGSMSMMDAGVPMIAPISGIAMGLIKEGDDFIVLSDIIADEDHLGDMDFKVAGSKDGITALQMDIKVRGITFEIMEKALEQAKIIGEQMLKKHPNNRELRFEHLAGLGLWGESIGIIRAATEGIATRMKEACEAMIRLDPEFMKGVGKRSLAVLNYKVPSIPFIISWPDKKKSMALMTEVMASYPNDLANTFYYAETLVENGRAHEALPYLQQVLAFTPDKEHLLEQRVMHLEAKKLLLKIKGK
jgi:hypothetical protein